MMMSSNETASNKPVCTREFTVIAENSRKLVTDHTTNRMFEKLPNWFAAEDLTRISWNWG